MKFKEIISYPFSGFIILCILFLIAIFVHWEFFATTPYHQKQPQVSQTRQIKNWKQLEFTGARSGPAKIPPKVTVVYEDFPIENIYPYVFKVSIAAECARRQGLPRLVVCTSENAEQLFLCVISWSNRRC